MLTCIHILITSIYRVLHVVWARARTCIRNTNSIYICIYIYAYIHTHTNIKHIQGAACGVGAC